MHCVRSRRALASIVPPSRLRAGLLIAASVLLGLGVVVAAADWARVREL